MMRVLLILRQLERHSARLSILLVGRVTSTMVSSAHIMAVLDWRTDTESCVKASSVQKFLHFLTSSVHSLYLLL